MGVKSILKFSLKFKLTQNEVEFSIDDEKSLFKSLKRGIKMNIKLHFKKAFTVSLLGLSSLSLIACSQSAIPKKAEDENAQISSIEQIKKMV